jgi:hypothetical protein
VNYPDNGATGEFVNIGRNQLYYTLLANRRHTVFEDDATGDDAGKTGGDDAAGKTGGDAGKTPDPKGQKMLTQADFNKALAEDRRKHQEQTKKALAEVDALRSKARLTQEERDDLDKRYQDMQNQLLTKEELAAQEKAKLRKEHETKLKEVSSDRDSWKDRFTNASIRREITDAAAKNDAYNPSQIVALLQSKTRLVEERDNDGNPTGRFKPEIQFEDTDKEGKPVTLTLTPEKAVERMKELPESMNLFKGTGVGGLGKNNQPSGKKADPKQLAGDAEAYRKARKDGTLTF